MATIKEGILGTDLQNAQAQALEDRIAAKDPNSPQAKYQRLLEFGSSIMGKSPKEDKRLLPEGSSAIGQGAAEGLKKYQESQGMKKGGKVKSSKPKASSASKRADGCCVKGKTKGKYL